MDPVQQNSNPAPVVNPVLATPEIALAPSTPVGVKVITTIIILMSILSIVALFPAYAMLTLKNPENESKIIVSLAVSGIISFLYIVLAVYLRRMKRWSLYVYSVAAGISILGSTYSFIQGEKLNWIGIVVPAVVLIYLWSIQAKFTSSK